MENKINSLSKYEDAGKILQKLKDNAELSIIEEIIKDNKVEFKHKDKIYRVRLLNRFEKEQLDEMRCRRYGQLIQDDNVLLESDLRKIYKKRGMDVNELDEEIRKLELEKNSQELKLGEAIANKIGNTVLKTYKIKIEEIQDNITLSLIKKSGLLAYSLENRLLNYVAEIITYLSLEVKKEDEWIRAFKTFEDFRQYPDEVLIEKAGGYSIKLHYNL